MSQRRDVMLDDGARWLTKKEAVALCDSCAAQDPHGREWTVLRINLLPDSRYKFHRAYRYRVGFGMPSYETEGEVIHRAGSAADQGTIW